LRDRGVDHPEKFRFNGFGGLRVSFDAICQGHGDTFSFLFQHQIAENSTASRSQRLMDSVEQQVFLGLSQMMNRVCADNAVEGSQVSLEHGQNILFDEAAPREMDKLSFRDRLHPFRNVDADEFSAFADAGRKIAGARAEIENTS
jgi:hypothetical protein